MLIPAAKGTAAVYGGTNSVTSEGSKLSKLHVEGAKLCDENGKQVQLRGVSTHGIAWFPRYVNKKLFTELKEKWGANVVRLAMYTAEYGGYCSGGNKKELKKLIKKGVRYAAEAGLYVIVDWHILNDNDPTINQKEAVKFFRQMSKALAKYDNVIYEICNEPNGGTTWKTIKKYAKKVIPVIRKNAPDAVIVVGTPNWSQYVLDAAADPIKKYDNICYTLHFYAATHKEDLRNDMVKAIQKGLPIFVTEFGICDASGNGVLDYDSANEWIKTMDKYGVSYVCWNLANKDESSSLFKSSCQKTYGFALSDLSDQGKWLYKLLSGKSGDTVTSIPDTDKTETKEETPTGGDTGDQKESKTETDKDDNLKQDGNSQDVKRSSYDLVGKSGNLEYTAICANSWEENGKTCRQYSLTVKNVGKARKSWKIRLKFDKKITLINSWNGEFRLNGKELVIVNAGHNGALGEGESTADIGFIVSF